MFNQTRWLRKYMLTDFQIPCSANGDFLETNGNIILPFVWAVGLTTRWDGQDLPILSCPFVPNYQSGQRTSSESRSNLNSKTISQSLNFLNDVSLLSYVTNSIINDTSFTYGWHVIYLLFIKHTCHTHMTKMSDLGAS